MPLELRIKATTFTTQISKTPSAHHLLNQISTQENPRKILKTLSHQQKTTQISQNPSHLIQKAVFPQNSELDVSVEGKCEWKCLNLRAQVELSWHQPLPPLVLGRTLKAAMTPKRMQREKWTRKHICQNEWRKRNDGGVISCSWGSEGHITNGNFFCYFFIILNFYSTYHMAVWIFVSY